MSAAAELIPPEPPGQLSGSAFGRLVRVFYEPAKVFAELDRTPTFVAALLVMMVVTLASSLVITPRIDFEATFHEAIAQRPEAASRLSDGDMQRAIDVQKKIATAMSYLAPITVVLIYLLLGGLYFLALKVLGSPAEFKPVFAGVVHALVPPGIVGGVLTAVVALSRASFTGMEVQHLVKSSVASFLDPETSKPLLALAGVLDAFNVWQWVLLAIALPLLGKVSKSKAVVAIAIIWGLWTAARVAFAAAF